MRTKLFIVAAGFLFAIAIGAMADDTEKTREQAASEDLTPVTPENILNKIHTSNMTEIDLAQLALSKSNNDKVDEYANMLIKHHKAADEKVQNLAKEKGFVLVHPVSVDSAAKDAVTTPNSPAPQLKDSEKQEITKLRTLSGEQFDREYMLTMVKGHNKLLTTLDTAEGQLKDDQVKDLVDDLQPTVRDHADRANKLAKELGGTPEDIVQTNR